MKEANLSLTYFKGDHSWKIISSMGWRVGGVILYVVTHSSSLALALKRWA